MALQEEPKVEKVMETKETAEPSDVDDEDDISWMDVVKGCCCHSPIGWFWIIFRLFWVAFFLYFFIVGLDILGAGAGVFTGCVAGELFGDEQNPVTGLMIGIILTVCMQSSSTTTSITVSLVGAGAISVASGIYIIMGANIGTSVTSTIVAIGQISNDDQFERAFAGATVNDVFNYLAVIILFPLEVITGMLNAITTAMVKDIELGTVERRNGFVRKYIRPVGEMVINQNRRVTDAVATGSGTCADFYPTECDDPANPTVDTCSVGLIRCNDWGCPVFFESGANRNDDELAGLAAFFIGVTILFICLGGLVMVLSAMLLGASTKIIQKATRINGYVAILVGMGITIAVQSSSITTATLTPLAGMGIIRLEEMFPLTLGANIGTTLTGIMAALAGTNKNAMQVALAHLFFNLFGILIWFPIPFMRRVPLHLATLLGKTTRAWKGFAFVYLAVMFAIIPFSLFVISEMFGSKDATQITIATIMLLILVGVIGFFVYWWVWRDGKVACGKFFANRKRRVKTLETLPYDVHWALRKTKELQDHTGIQPAPAPTIAPGKDPYASVADDMDFVMEAIQALILHAGLPSDVEEGDEQLGSLIHKEKETMPEIDMSDWGKYQAINVVIILTTLGLIFWGIAELWLIGSVAGRGFAGYLMIMVGTYVIFNVYHYVTSGARSYSQARYRDLEHKKACKASYITTMSQLIADLDKLVFDTSLPIRASNASLSIFGSLSRFAMSINAADAKGSMRTAELEESERIPEATDFSGMDNA